MILDSNNPNAAFGAHLEPFHGIPTFMRRPAKREFDGVDVAIVGIPFDSGASYRAGARFGPRAIREASLLLWGHHVVHGVTPTDVLEIIDYGDIEVFPVDIQATMDSITRDVSAILTQGVKVISLGGDHSITLPLLRAHAERYGALALVHFDSHPDTWRNEFGDFPYSHGTPFRRAIEEGLIDTNAYIQVGIRGSTSGSRDLEEARQLGARVITIGEAFDMGIPAVIDLIKQIVGKRSLYVSLDIDAADPAYAPGTGTPEIGGFSSFQLQQIVRGLQGLSPVGFDLVEVCPPYDHSNITAILAANLAFEFLSLLALDVQ